MRIVAVLVFVLVATRGFAAEPKVSPADRAGEAGHPAISVFHEVVAPAWHKAYPDKDYDALIKAGPEFEKALESIRGIEPKMKNKVRKAAFLESREKLASFVTLYAKAAKEGSKEEVYNLLPDLHDAFENSALALLPVSYPEFEAVRVTTRLILEKHLPANNADGITGSTETLVKKLVILKESSLPESLQGTKDKMSKELETLANLGVKIQETCTSKDMAKYKTLLAELNKKLSSLSENYL